MQVRNLRHDRIPDCARFQTRRFICLFSSPVFMNGHTTSEHDLPPASTPQDLVTRAQTLVSRRQFAKAVEYLDRALEQRPDMPEWTRFRGNVLQILARHEEALRDFRNLVAGTPSDAQAWQKLAQSFRSLGRVDEAEEAFMKSLELDPRSVDSMADLGNLCRDAGRYPEAVEWLSKAVHLAPSDSGLQAMLGAALLAAGSPADARQNLEKAFQLNPYDRTALAYLYIALCQTGDRELASALVRPELLVRSFQRPGSAGGSGQADDLEDRLADHVRNHPSLEFERAGNTTRGGAHTGQLLDEAPGPVLDLVEWIEDRVRAYLDALPMDGSHPYLAWKPDGWDIDIWGIVIRSGGYQLSHIHRDGWISGVYYAAVPGSVQSEDAEDQEGCLELGRPPEQFCGSADFPTMVIRPRPGRLNLFPSYLWHRTLPYEEDQQRICIAFDIRPKL